MDIVSRREKDFSSCKCSYRIEKRCLLYVSRAFAWTVFRIFGSAKIVIPWSSMKIAFWQVWMAISFEIYIYIYSEIISNRSSKGPLEYFRNSKPCQKLFDSASKLVPINPIIRSFEFSRLFCLVSSYIIIRMIVWNVKSTKETRWKLCVK